MSLWPSGTSTPSILPPDMPHEGQDVSGNIRQQNADKKRVGLELGKSSVVKQRKSRSKVWDDFEKYKDENGKDRARCKGCQKDFDGSSKLGTTHLKNHFTSCQRKRNGVGGGDEPANLAGDSSNPIAIQEKSVMDQRLNHLDAARMIIKQGDALRINSTNMGYIIDVYKEEKEKLRNYFGELSCCMCLTIQGFSMDIWSTVWFIDDDWKLKNEIIGFLEWNNDEITAKNIKEVLLEWGIENNLSFIVIDVKGDADLIQRIYYEIREDCLSTQGSLPFNYKLFCCESFPVLDGGFHGFFLNKMRRFSFHRLCNLFNNIRNRSFRNENFRNAIDVAIKSLGKEVTFQVIPTEQELFNKLFYGGPRDILGVLENVLGLKETLFELENSHHPHFRNLTKEEWDVLRAIYDWLEYYSDFHLLYCSKYNTANAHFPLVCRMCKCFKELRKCLSFDDYEGVMEVADNYWCTNNLVLAVAIVLDPRFRMDIVKNWYEKIFGDEWETEFTKFMDYFNKIYSEYARGINKCTLGLEENNSSFSYEMLDPSGKLCKSSHELDHVQWLNPELHLYFEEVKFPSIKDFDILEWWRVHARYFPTLAKMARDFLSIQISCTPVKLSIDEFVHLSEFGITEAYTCTKSWLREEL